MSQLIPAWVNGELVNRDKLEVHKLGLKHPAISVFLIANGKTLLQRRAMIKYHTPGLWANTVCTHPHPGEDMKACATRRLGEELGIGGVKLESQHHLEYRADVGNGLIEHEVVEIFVAHVPEGLSISPNPEEVMASRWISFEQLKEEVAATPTEFTPWLQIYVSDHLTKIIDPVHA
ncbi:MAG: isopentenyl-diphosphate Delta-isomerase [Pseudomonadota bacterium]